MSWTKEKWAEWRKDYYTKNREKILAKALAKRIANPELYNERAKQFQRRDPERAREISRKSHAKNKAKRNAYTRNWHARKKQSAEYAQYLEENRIKDKARYKRDNGARMKAYQKLYAAKNPEKVRERHRLKYLKNKISVAIKARQKYLANPQATKDRVKAWNKNNPEKASALRRHVANLRRIREKCSKEEAHRIKSFMSKHIEMRWHRCYYCDKDFTGMIHFDHIVPLARNGKHEASNLCVSCPACNMSKGVKQITDLRFPQQLLPI